jgi:hypothetical protein
MVAGSLLGIGLAGAAERALNSDLGGVPSLYTPILSQLLQSPARLDNTAPPSSSKPLELRCWTTAGDDLYVGVGQSMRIQAPFARVEAILDDIDHYKDLFRDFKDIHVITRDGGLLHTYWEQKVPLFFIPNVKYEMTYLIDASSPDRRIYRYQLSNPSDVKQSDGFIMIHKEDEGFTRYVEYDFFNAEWGAAKVLGKDKLWREAVEGFAVSDQAIKLKAENPTWPSEKVRSESGHFIPKNLIQDCVEGRKPFVLPSL